MSNKGIDPILVSVLQRRFKSLTEEMGLTMLRTARSPILHEARDFVTGLFDAKARMLEQTEYVPILAFALQPACQFVADYFNGEVYPGDVILHSDVFTRCNQHADVTVFKPVFYGEELVAWAACKGHQADIGGATPGGYNPQAREVWQEALRIPPVKVYEKGKLRRDVWNLIFSNVRYDMVAEDVRSQIGGCVVGERGIRRLIDRYGQETFGSHVEALFDSTERMMRSEIRAIPDGVYVGESYMNYDGITPGTRSRIKVTITVSGDEITFDYTGTDPQTPGYVNAPYSASLSAVVLSFLMLVKPDMPHNDGMTRAIHVHFPEGSIVNPRFPAATMFGNHLAEQHAEAIFKALASALPGKVTAGWNKLLSGTIIGVDPRTERPYVDVLFIGFKGGSGGTHGVDGYDYIGPVYGGGGCLGQDYEMFEFHSPHFLLKHEYLPDSAGAGQWRGGLGAVTVFRFSADTMLVTIGDETEEGAFGLFGGKEGSPNRIELVYPDASRLVPKAKDLVASVPSGTLYVQYAGGGGGYGDPCLRPPGKVAEEVRNGLLSVEKAAEDYGVIIDPLTLEVKLQETEPARRKKQWGNRQKS